MTDSIADMLTRIRNAITARHEMVEVPTSKIKVSIAQLLKDEGYIKDFHLVDYKGQGKILLSLRYSAKSQHSGKNQPTIVGLKRMSTPGRRVYVGYRDLKPVFNGLGMAILSTPKGVLTDRVAREMKVGGELLLNVW